MHTSRSVLEFDDIDIASTARCWQIDSDHLEGALSDGDWEDLFAQDLIDLADSHESATVLCAATAGPSTDFAHHGYSVWIAIAGAGPVVKAASDILRELIPAGCIRPCQVQPGQYWRARIRIQDGFVWRPIDDAEWHALDKDDPETGAPIDEDEDEWDVAPSSDADSNEAARPKTDERS